MIQASEIHMNNLVKEHSIFSLQYAHNCILNKRGIEQVQFECVCDSGNI